MHYCGTFTWSFEALVIAGYDDSNANDRAVLDYFDMSDRSIGRSLGILYGMVVFVRVLCYLVLKVKHRGVRV